MRYDREEQRHQRVLVKEADRDVDALAEPARPTTPITAVARMFISQR